MENNTIDEELLQSNIKKEQKKQKREKLIRRIITIPFAIVGLIVVLSLIMNILLPNTITATINNIEDSIYRWTAISIDINGDDHRGSVQSNVKPIIYIYNANELERITE